MFFVKHFEIIADTPTVVRNNIEIPCTLYSVSLKGSILQNYGSVQSQNIVLDYII